MENRARIVEPSFPTVPTRNGNRKPGVAGRQKCLYREGPFGIGRLREEEEEEEKNGQREDSLPDVFSANESQPQQTEAGCCKSGMHDDTHHNQQRCS